jgi:hypothetical protein
MNTRDRVVVAGNAVIGAIVASAVLGWAASYDVGGQFTPALDFLKTVAAIRFDPNSTILLLAAGAVFMWAFDDGM